MRNRVVCVIGGLVAAGWLLGGCGGGAALAKDAAAEDAPAPQPDAPIGDGGPADGPADAGGGFVCDPVTQAGCVTGQKCDIAASGTFACVPDGDLGEFQVCAATRPSACHAGFSCHDTNFGDSRCARLCSSSAQCRADEACSSVRTTTDGRQYRTCTSSQVCNPIVDDCPAPADACMYIVTGVATTSFCFAPGAVADGAPCDPAHHECTRGSSCLPTGVGQPLRCFRMCDPAGGLPDCPTGASCTPFATVGPQAVGACGFPAP